MTEHSESPAKPTVRQRVVAIINQLRGGALTPGRAAASVAAGLFVGMIPLVGLQLAFVLAICLPLRLDAAVAYLASHVSNPLTFPFLLGLELEIGSLVLTGHHAPHTLRAARDLGLGSAAGQVTVGALLLGTASAVVGGALVFRIALGYRDARAVARAAARVRTLSRYAGAAPRVRYYVRAKLVTDPAYATLCDLGQLGRVVDVGSGFGQLALGLLDAGSAASAGGIDLNEERVRSASLAAGPDGHFVVADAETADLPEADTFLFIDSLHYMSPEAQDAVLARAARALAEGGQILIREVEVRPTLRSLLTRWLERRAVLRARGIAAGFRASAELAQVLGRLGLVAEVRVPEAFSVFDNVLVLATKPKRQEESAIEPKMSESPGAPAAGT